MKRGLCSEFCNYTGHWHIETAMRRHKKCHHLNAVDKHSSTLCKVSNAEEPSVDEVYSEVTVTGESNEHFLEHLRYS